MSRVLILGKDTECEACASLTNVKSLQIGAHIVSLCESCRDVLLRVLASDLEVNVETRPVCNFCGKKGYIGEGTHVVHGYEILNSCHRCELNILSDDGEE